jgi:tRNA dimethylallyltransferase
MPDKSHAILFFGPTAVGKTALVESLFAGRDGFPVGAPGAEVISADSVQVYRGLDIGSAKPSAGLRRRIAHHLIDILDPREQFTAGAFVKAAEGLIAAICARGRVPVVSGGTAFYFRGLLYGLPPTPPADAAIRAALEEECSLLGLDGMYRRLQCLDPPSAGRISANDRYRIMRALEVHRAAGRPLSALAVPGRPRGDIDFLVIGLEREREDLYGRIDRRVDAMFAGGLVDEVKGLMKQGLRETDPGMRGIGYREFFPALAHGCLRVKDVAARVKTDSRRYAKRQLTFFKSFPGVRWLHPRAEEDIRRLVSGFLSGRGRADTGEGPRYTDE